MDGTSQDMVVPEAEVAEVCAKLDAMLTLATTRELEGIHAGLTAAVAAYPVAYLDSPEPSSRQDPTAAPDWLWQALSDIATDMGYEVDDTQPVIAGDEGVLGRCRRAAAEVLPGFMVAIPHSVEIISGMSYASKCRVITHELAHAIAPPTVSGWLAEVTAEAAAALVTGVLRASDGQFSVHKCAYNAATAESMPYGDARVMEQTRPHAVALAGLILLSIQDWQKEHAS